jgi:tetratricopeptide (TPR) repeat protein
VYPQAVKTTDTLKPSLHTTDEPQASHFAQLGYREALEGNREASVSYYTQAIELDSMVANYYYNRGLSYHQLKDYPSAISWYNETISLEPAYAN